MANVLYTEVVNTLAVYIGPERAKTAFDRQFKHCSSTEDTITRQQFGQIMNYVAGAAGVWLGGDKAKVAEMTAKLKAFV